ncbi:hypothetical protein H5U35_05805 [Candidatus Aerophobetes bacterium]|nr:hypothetical protein [Candidatus Aerophobetes bacterium]
MEHKKILIVEDDRDVVEVLRIILEEESFEVKATFTGREGLFLVERESPDLMRVS